MNRMYNRLLEKDLIDMVGRNEIMNSEVKSVKKVIAQLKKTEEESYKKIHELQMRCDMQKEEMQQKTEAFEKRINTLIRDFVKVFKKLASEFQNFKSYASRENDVFNSLITKKDDVIERQKFEIDEYKLALRIPRQHYKYIEKLKFEELMKQRDEIIKKLKKKFGVDQEKALAMLIMPDPSLSPEKQMEMLSGGKVGVSEENKGA